MRYGFVLLSVLILSSFADAEIFRIGVEIENMEAEKLFGDISWRLQDSSENLNCLFEKTENIEISPLSSERLYCSVENIPERGVIDVGFGGEILRFSYGGEGDDAQISIFPSNRKDESRYGNVLFLVKYDDWRTVLASVPYAFWTDSFGDIRAYPFLVYDDISQYDRIGRFVSEYSPEKIFFVSEYGIDCSGDLDEDCRFLSSVTLDIPDESKPSIEAKTADDMLTFWQSYGVVVYSENDYATALQASAYASLIDAPLIIEGYNDEINLGAVNVVCIGNVQKRDVCSTEYSAEEISERYADSTSSDKAILMNSDDIAGGHEESLAASVLASFRHEVIVSCGSEDTDSCLKEKIGLYDNEFGYLTVMAHPDNVPISEYGGTIRGRINLRSLDQTEYADFDNDFVPDMATGRIMGLDIADVFLYVNRIIFFDRFSKNTNTIFMSRTSRQKYIPGYFNAVLWSNVFSGSGYSSGTERTLIEEETGGSVFPPESWKDKTLISYADHGQYNWAGIEADSLPELSYPVMMIDACGTCSRYDESSFCMQAIRKGAVSYFGAVHTNSDQSIIFMMALDSIYRDGTDTGTAIRDAYIIQKNLSQKFIEKNIPNTEFFYEKSWMNTLIGDPAFSPYVPFRLENCLAIECGNIWKALIGSFNPDIDINKQKCDAIDRLKQENLGTV